MPEITAAFLVSRSRFKTTTNIWSKSYWSEIHLHLFCHVELLENHPSKARSFRVPLLLQEKAYVLLRDRYVQKLKLSGDLKLKQNIIETHGIVSTIRHHDGQRWAQNHELMSSVACSEHKTVRIITNAVYMINIYRRFEASSFLDFDCRIKYTAPHPLRQHLQFLQTDRTTLKRRTRTTSIVASFAQIATVARHEYEPVT